MVCLQNKKHNLEIPEMSSTEDPVESMLKRTGCIELHYKVQECIAETGDWRKCQDVVSGGGNHEKKDNYFYPFFRSRSSRRA